MSAESGAEIRYTLDGSTPTAASSLYNSAITLNATTTVKAIAIKNGTSSSVATQVFTKSEQPSGDLSITVDGVSKNLGDEITIDSSATIVVNLPSDSNLIGKKVGYNAKTEATPSNVTLAAGANTITLDTTMLTTYAQNWGAGVLESSGFETNFTVETVFLKIKKSE